jgi:hypothetical protein
MVNPPNVRGKLLEQLSPEQWGMWLSAENAELIGFNPEGDPNWKYVDLENGWDNSTGYISHATRFLVIHQSEMEVQEKIDGRWRFVDVAYKYGIMTEAMERCKASQGNTMRSVVRTLLILLGKNNQPLHDGVVQMTMRGVFGASFGSQFRAFKAEANKAFFKAAGQAEKRLSDDILNRFFPFSIAIAPPKTSDASPSIYVSGRAAFIEETTATEVYGRKVNLFAQSFEALYQPKDSELGQKLAQYRAEYSDFPKPRNNQDQTEEAPVNDYWQQEVDASTGEVTGYIPEDVPF